MAEKDIDNIVVRDLKVVLPILWLLVKRFIKLVWYVLVFTVPLFLLGYVLFFAPDIIKVVIFIVAFATWIGKCVDKFTS